MIFPRVVMRLRNEGRYCLFFGANFSGDELQGIQDQALSSGWPNQRAGFIAPGVHPCLPLFDVGRSTTDYFCLHL